MQGRATLPLKQNLKITRLSTIITRSLPLTAYQFVASCWSPAVTTDLKQTHHSDSWVWNEQQRGGNAGESVSQWSKTKRNIQNNTLLLNEIWNESSVSYKWAFLALIYDLETAKCKLLEILPSICVTSRRQRCKKSNSVNHYQDINNLTQFHPHNYLHTSATFLNKLVRIKQTSQDRKFRGILFLVPWY